MGWDSGHKSRTREQILRSAAQLFTQRGFDSVSVDEVMAAAGLTRGAFYAHFRSKADLYAEAISHAAELARARLQAALPAEPSLPQVAAAYLEADNRSCVMAGCPLAFLATDIAQRDEQVRGAYTDVFKSLMAALAQLQPEAERGEIMRAAVLMVGGMALARALNDDALSREVLRECQQGVAEAAGADL